MGPLASTTQGVGSPLTTAARDLESQPDRSVVAFRHLQGAGRNPIRVTGTRTRPHGIEGRFQKQTATGGHRRAAPGGEPLATGGGKFLNRMSPPVAQ